MVIVTVTITTSTYNLLPYLQIENLVCFRGFGENWKKPRLEFEGDGVDDEVSERFGAELVAGCFTLHLPEVAVGVEDSVTQKILEEVDEAFSLGVVVEFGFEHVFHVVRVGR